MITPLARMLFNTIGVSLDFESAGRMTLSFEYPDSDVYVYLHLLPGSEFQVWGHKRDHYDGAPLHDFGLGPLLLVCVWGIR